MSSATTSHLSSVFSYVAIVAPAEPAPEPPDWPATAPPVTSRLPDSLPLGEQSGYRLQQLQGFPNVLLTWLHSIPFLWGSSRSQICCTGHHWEAEGHMSSTQESSTLELSEALGPYSPHPARYITCQCGTDQEAKASVREQEEEEEEEEKEEEEDEEEEEEEK
ncbi:hypothetical protein PAL_GLEAN10003243 [Pteropus alecto]|uniref:Uncharacterized protein n=1 Tax=Pteropus alecto TaxID=9402 RepID=L5JUC6_PTEAL|nr:hypothetical protein PAL_GLEAN10003243 [Pteropus alecto]